MIGTNRELMSIQRILDCRILALRQSINGVPDPDCIAARLTALGRERIAVSAIPANRRIEAAKKVVDLTRWFTENSAFSDGPTNRGPFEGKRWLTNQRQIEASDLAGIGRAGLAVVAIAGQASAADARYRRPPHRSQRSPRHKALPTLLRPIIAVRHFIKRSQALAHRVLIDPGQWINPVWIA